jgi:phosphate transport system protein
MRTKFEEQLATLNRELIEMGAQCEDVISMAADALLSGDTALAKKIAPLDSIINQKERAIETMCLKLLLQQQPVARDLRQISVALKMITDLERIGHQAEDIAEIIGFLNGRTGSDCGPIGEMAAATIKMVTESIDAYVKYDMNLANTVVEYDDVVDALFLKVKSSLIDMIANNPKEGEYALDLLMIAKYFERIGDHAVNIAAWVVFAVTGVHNKGD